jgi:predicted nucleic acid-binding protein
MARVKLLVDTDVFIDAIRGVKSARDLFRTESTEIFCSILTKKELLLKEGLSASERKRVNNLLSKVKVLKIDKMIQANFTELLHRYGDIPERRADYIIAATALAKRLPLLTRNRKHFKDIEHLVLTPIY